MGRLVFGSLSYWHSVCFRSVFIHSQTFPKEGEYAFSVNVSLTNAFAVKSLWHRAAHISIQDLYTVMQWAGRGSAHRTTPMFSVGICPSVAPMPKLMPRLELWLPQQGWDCVVCGSGVLNAEHLWVTLCWPLLQSQSTALAQAGRAEVVVCCLWAVTVIFPGDWGRCGAPEPAVQSLLAPLPALPPAS